MKKFYKFLVYILICSFFTVWVNAEESTNSTVTSVWISTTSVNDDSKSDDSADSDSAATDWTTTNNVDDDSKSDDDDDDSKTDDDDSKIEDNHEWAIQDKPSNIKQIPRTIHNKKEELKKIHDKRKEYLKKKRDEQRNNIKEFRVDNKKEIKTIHNELKDEEKAKFKAKRDEFKVKQKELLDTLKNKDLTADEKEERKSKLKDLREIHFNNFKETFKWNNDALKILEERKSVYEENRAIRSEISDKRKEFRQKAETKILKYKKAFVKRLKKHIDKIPYTKLETVADKIWTAIEKIEANARLSNSKKESYLTQLEALLNVINDRLNETDEEEEFDIESLLDFEL